MRKAILFFNLSFFLCFDLLAQNSPLFCKGHGYRGYVFDTTYFLMKSIEGQRSKANLTLEEIRAAESILRSQLPEINRLKPNQSSGCPNINRKLDRYWRQYFGFINVKDEKVVWINMFWNKELIGDAKRELVGMYDGCSYYWNIEINLTTRKAYNLQVNGSG